MNKQRLRLSLRGILLIFLLCNILLATSCWNYEEISDKSIVAGFAIDYDEELDGIFLTVEVVSPKSQKGEFTTESYVISGSGLNVFDAVRNLISKSGKKLFWSHSKVLILSKEIFKKKEKLIGIIDFIKRHGETRGNLWIVLSEEKSAYAIFNDGEINIEKVMSYYIDNILKNQSAISKYKPITFWKFTDTLASEGKSITLPTIEFDNEQGKNIPVLFGNAVFRGIKYVGRLDGDQSKNLLLIQDEFKGGLIILEDIFQDKDENVSLEVFKSKTNITPIFSSDNIAMNIGIEIDVSIGEINGELDHLKREGINKLEKISEEMLVKQLSDLMYKLQKEYKSDILGFGNIVEIENPKLWKSLKSNWNSEFSKIKTNFKVKVKIKGSGLRSEPIKASK